MTDDDDPPPSATAPPEVSPDATADQMSASATKDSLLVAAASKLDDGGSLPIANHEVAEPPDSFDKAVAWLGAHGAPYAVALIAATVGICLAAVFRAEITSGDDLSFHFAESARIMDCIRGGDWDLWNPSANGGFASAYYYQVMPQLASAVPGAIFGHHLFWFQMSCWLPLVLAPVLGYRGMRLMGATPWQAASAAFVLAFAMGKSRWGFGVEGTFAVGLYTQTWALAFYPLALGHAVRWALEGKGFASTVAWSAFVGLCHPFAVIGLGIALIVAFVAHAIYYITPSLAGEPRAKRLLGLELGRLAVFSILLAISQLPTLVPLAADYVGFGGFPHRVNDEVGPGFSELGKWAVTGQLLDWTRAAQVGAILTFLIPITLVFGRGARRAWLWVPALVFAFFLGIGPHLGKTGSDDLFPMVRFLGAMQVSFALAIGAGMASIVMWLWATQEGTRRAHWFRYGVLITSVMVISATMIATAAGKLDSGVFRVVDTLLFGAIESVWAARLVCMVPVAALITLVPTIERGLVSQFWMRTTIAAVVAVLAVLVVLPSIQYQAHRVRWLSKAALADMTVMMDKIGAHSTARKQVGPGTENHLWNMMSYVHARIPSLLMMGGGGLQASPNYDFVWSVRDFKKLAWVYDTPYLTYNTDKQTGLPAGPVIAASSKFAMRRLPTDSLVAPIQIVGTLEPGPTGAGSPARAAAIAWLRSRQPYENLHLGYPGFGGKTDGPHGRVLRTWRQDSPGDQADIVADVEVTAPTTFVVRESWHPRWHAYVDGKEVVVRRVTPDFPAVDLPAGAKQLQLRFERPWWCTAIWLAWPGAVLLAWLATRVVRRRWPQVAS